MVPNHFILAEGSDFELFITCQIPLLLLKDPGSIFTYCPEYNSASVVTVDSDDKKKEEMKAKAKWLTPKGFVAPGSKSAQESNHHPLKPGTARRDELNKVCKPHAALQLEIPLISHINQDQTAKTLNYFSKFIRNCNNFSQFSRNTFTYLINRVRANLELH